MNTQFDKFLINVMDRFVWFILLLVMSYLIADFTKTTGYTRGYRSNMIPINESVFMNLVELPDMQQSPNHNLDIRVMQQTNQEANSANGEEKTFSLRPLIDSIFEIPLSALNAVNRFVQRLTGNYYGTNTIVYPEKTTLKEKNS